VLWRSWFNFDGYILQIRSKISFTEFWKSTLIFISFQLHNTPILLPHSYAQGIQIVKLAGWPHKLFKWRGVVEGKSQRNMRTQIVINFMLKCMKLYGDTFGHS